MYNNLLWLHLVSFYMLFWNKICREMVLITLMCYKTSLFYFISNLQKSLLNIQNCLKRISPSEMSDLLFNPNVICQPNRYLCCSPFEASNFCETSQRKLWNLKCYLATFELNNLRILKIRGDECLHSIYSNIIKSKQIQNRF